MILVLSPNQQATHAWRRRRGLKVREVRHIGAPESLNAPWHAGYVERVVELRGFRDRPHADHMARTIVRHVARYGAGDVEWVVE
jgi:hypothetical protein